MRGHFPQSLVRRIPPQNVGRGNVDGVIESAHAASLSSVTKPRTDAFQGLV
jgi:hypothetical protein